MSRCTDIIVAPQRVAPPPPLPPPKAERPSHRAPGGAKNKCVPRREGFSEFIRRIRSKGRTSCQMFLPRSHASRRHLCFPRCRVRTTVVVAVVVVVGNVYLSGERIRRRTLELRRVSTWRILLRPKRFKITFSIHTLQ